MKRSYLSYVCFTFGSFLALALVFAVGGCKKEARKDCGCGSTVITSVSNKSGLLSRAIVGSKATWKIYVRQPKEVIPYYTGIICNAKTVEELITKEGLEDKVASPDMEPIAIVFSGDLFKSCAVKDDHIFTLLANYSFDVRLDTLSLTPGTQ